MKRFFLFLFMLLLLIGAAPVAHAQEVIPEVSTLSELQNAIIQADAGDTIKIMQTIVINEAANIGIEGKPVTLCAAESVSVFLSFEGNWSDASCSNLYDLTIDGEGMPRDTLMCVDVPNAVYISTGRCKNVNSNGFGSALRLIKGECYVMNSTFENCFAPVGGAVYADVNTTLSLSGCDFVNNNASRDGGAVYCMGKTDIFECSFAGNGGVNGSGGAVAGINMAVENSTFTNNRALYGGGLFLIGGGAITNCKLYNNIGDFAGADLFSDGVVTITADDYSSLYSEEMTVGGYDAFAWYVDSENNRYSENIPTDALTTTDNLSTPALKFVLYKEPTPKPEPTPEPSRPSSGGSSYSPEPKPVPVPVPEPVYPTLSCGNAEIDGDAVVYLTDALQRFTPAQERLTRGRFAALLFGILTDQSQDRCNVAAKTSFQDLDNSPYKNAVASLTAAGVLLGHSDGLFKPDDPLSYGELLSVLTAFVEPKTAYVGSFASHWAEPAATIACAYGWIADVPINLDAPTTYGAFVNLMVKIYELERI